MNNMKYQSYTYMAIALSLIFFMAGCASHGKLSVAPNDEHDALLADLAAHTDQYVVHYHGNSEKIVSGILFDPKNDGKSIRPEGVLWKEVSSSETIAGVIDRIQRNNYSAYIPRLFRILGPEDDIYGYLFTGWSYMVIKPVDEKTLRVYGLAGPPEYEDMHRGGR
ncbi:MAG: hypothetical protein JRH03_15135 [Deltaproteobacteria bacterium]|nr:hypothetical protein [Deltaproteobacteria bacterium]